MAGVRQTSGSMHVSVHVRSGDPKEQERRLTTHSLVVYVALGDDGRPVPVREWAPATDEDRALDTIMGPRTVNADDRQATLGADLAD